jgi:ribose transport system substrate-binding protein
MLTGQSESQTIWAENTEAAATSLGWSTVVKDGQNNPQVWSQQAEQLVAEKVDAILTMGIDAPTITPALQSAKAAGIPVIATDITVDPTGSELFAANYSDNDAVLGEALASYAMDKTPGAKVVAQNLSVVYGADQYTKSAVARFKELGGDVQDVTDLDIANVTESFGKTATALVQSHPDADYLLSPADVAPILDLPALQQAGNTSTTLLARYDLPSTLKYIRSGAKVAVVAANTHRTNLQAIDSLAAYFASQKPIPRTYPNDDFESKVIDESNAPAEGQVYDFDALLEQFKTKWASEYKINA